MPKKLTQAEFIAKARAAHGNRYDYSKTVYLPQPQKITIRCPEHGPFMQVANNHMMGKGCSKCGNDRVAEYKNLTTGEFIKAALLKHGNKYDYSQTIYEHGKAKVKIVCPLHGEFKQSAGSHSRGAGCQKCQAAATGQRCVSNIDVFINRSRAVHGQKYDYSQVLYQGSKKRVKIICRLHGVFEQQPLNHLEGKGCSKCSGVFKLNTVTFIEKAQLVHGQQYDYSQVSYISAKNKVIIICPHHGAFFQNASSHLMGCGCPDCNGPANATWTRSEWTAKATGQNPQLYLIKCFDTDEVFYKIGITFRSVAKRFSSGFPYCYEVVKTLESPNAEFIYDFEKQIKRQFSALRYKPKKLFAGRFECFSSATEIIKAFPG